MNSEFERQRVVLPGPTLVGEGFLDLWRRRYGIRSLNRMSGPSLAFLALIVVFTPAVTPGQAKLPLPKSDHSSDVPEGFAIDLKASEADVLKAVELVSQDTVLHGTQVYSREDELTETEAATASAYFGPWAGPGHAFYKVRKKAISPQDFKNGTDIGTIAVRYVILGVAPDRTHLQI